MLDLGMQELIVIFVVALLVFGPHRLPEVGAKAGKIIGKLRLAFYEIKMNVNSQIENASEPYKEDFSAIDREIKEASKVNLNSIINETSGDKDKREGESKLNG